MSRTIITNSGSEFWTNVCSESTIGILCKISGAKYQDVYQDTFEFYKKNNLDTSKIEESKINSWFGPKMSYNMTEEETLDAAKKLRSLIDKSEELFPNFKGHFDKECTHDDLKYFLSYVSDYFENSKGYHCI